MRSCGTAPINNRSYCTRHYISRMAFPAVLVGTPRFLTARSCTGSFCDIPFSIVMLCMFVIVATLLVILIIRSRSSRDQAHTHDERDEQGENAFAKVLVMFHRFNSFLCLIYGCKVSGGRAGIARQRRSPHSFASRHFWRFANYKVVISNRLP